MGAAGTSTGRGGTDIEAGKEPMRLFRRSPPAHRPLQVGKPRHELDVKRFEQPDDVTCGPTCLKKVFHYYGDKRSFQEIFDGMRRNPDGGTLAVYLGLTALGLGYRAVLYPYDLRIFDPTWFELRRSKLREKLRLRAAAAQDPKVRAAAEAHATFLDEGGRIEFADLGTGLLTRILDRRHPIVCGLSSTYLYRQVRERPEDNVEDDIHGEPTGHFVVICGYSAGGKNFMVRDPSSHVPFSTSGRYVVPAQRLINAILLGDATHDAVLLELWPAARGQR
jgi:hypothetical protein